MACTFGTEPKSTAPTYYYTSVSDVISWLGGDAAAAWLRPLLTVLPVDLGRVADLCAAPPPEYQQIGALDIINVPAGLDKLQNNYKRHLWYLYCQ